MDAETTNVQIGVILTFAGRQTEGDFPDAARKHSPKGSRHFLSGASYALLDVLGRSLLDRTVDKLLDFGTMPPAVLPEGPASSQVLPSRSAKPSAFIEAWETAVGGYVQQGVELLLLLRTSAYTDLDYGELLQFHTTQQSSLTQVYGPDGPLDVALVSATVLRDGSETYRKQLSALIPGQERFFYRGYINRLRRAQDFRKLAEDGLYGQCALQPAGVEVEPGVWHGAGAQVDSSAVITGPAFIGAGSRVAACCTVSGASSVERNCEIDCGTLVDQSCVLPDTYIGVGLDVRRSIVSGKNIFHLERNVEIGIRDRRLIGAMKPAPVVAGAALFLWRELQRAD